MSLAVGFRDDKNIEYKLSFENDGYYWYLHPFFEALKNSTGIYVDLYGDAVFNRGNVNQIETALVNASSSLEAEENYFQVHCGTQVKPEKKEIYNKISKNELKSKLNIIFGIIKHIKEHGGSLVFEGD